MTSIQTFFIQTFVVTRTRPQKHGRDAAPHGSALFALALIVGLALLFLVAAPSDAASILDYADFTSSTGMLPKGGVTFDSHGNLFGTTQIGVVPDDFDFGRGNVWEIPAGTSAIHYVNFSGDNGSYPMAGVTFDSHGNLFGTAAYDGAYGYGDVWEIKAGTSIIVDVADFNITNGANPWAGVTIDSHGNLFGTTLEGGASNSGVVWEVKAGTNTILDVVAFNDSTGAGSIAGVTIDRQGNLFGTAGAGGSNNAGVVWEIKTGTNVLLNIPFSGSNGAYPQAGVTIDSHGNLFGTTLEGGSSISINSLGYGVIWEIKAGMSTIVDVADFTGGNGSYPISGVTFDNLGNMFGTASGGGAKGYGNIWAIKAGTTALLDIGDFNGYNGAYPKAGVTIDSHGNLFGTTQDGGSTFSFGGYPPGNGNVWELPGVASGPGPHGPN